MAAALCFSLLDVVATSTVVSIAEQTPFHDLFVRLAGTGLLATLSAAPIGLAVVALADQGPLTALLLLPLTVAVACNSRYAVAQRDEHLRFERLYESLTRSARLLTFDDALAALATEARSLGTGSVAVCCAIGLDDAWHGARADDQGCAPAPPEIVAAAVALADRGAGCELTRRRAPEVAVLDGDAMRALALSSHAEDGNRVIVVVARQNAANAAKSRVETLDAFTHQASLLISNALLHDERAVALAREIDLNRQKSDFVAAVSHELRTPLGVMLGSVHTLDRLHGQMTGEQEAQLLGMTIDQGQRLQRLIDELLLVAAAEHSEVPVDAETVDVAELLGAVATGVSAPTREFVERHCESGPIVADRSKLERILLNLVENAGKYALGSRIELTARPAGDNVRFAVVDHGPGIPHEDRERVFERFVQLDQSSTRRQGGTGLGLHLCRQLAEVIDAALALTETPGGGCTFTLTVPRGTPVEPVVRPYVVRVRPRKVVA